MQYEVVENTLVISIEDEKDREFIQDTLDNERNDLQALDDLCDGHTGWLGNQGACATAHRRQLASRGAGP